MIIYEPIWVTLEEKKLSTYSLISKHGLSSETIHRLKHDKSITLTTLNDLCKILDCPVEKIIKYIPDNA